jgi:hypothetical protein
MTTETLQFIIKGRDALADAQVWLRAELRLADVDHYRARLPAE